jgi:hypothetical protein
VLLPFPEGPPKWSVGGFPGTCHPAHVLASSRDCLSVFGAFRPGLSPTSRGSGVTKLMATAVVSFVALVLRVWACLTSYSHVVHRKPGLGGGPQCVGR